MRIIFYLKGLDCPNCAAKIEKEAGAVAGVTRSEMNLMQQELTLEADSDDGLLEKVTEIVHSHEPDVTVSVADGHRHPDEHGHCGCDTCGHDHDDGEEESFRPRVIRIAVGTVVYLGGLILGQRLGAVPHLLIIAAAYVILGYDVVIRAVRNLFRGRVFDENFLMTISTICAFLIGNTAEAAAVMLFYQIGELFQDMAVDRSRRSITELMDIRPDTASVLRGGEWLTVHPGAVEVGEVVMVRPGEKIPLDGDILEGSSHLDTRALTGESIPREVMTGDHVLSGCVNGDGMLRIRVTHEFGQSTASRVLELTKNAASRKAKSEKFITRFARCYTPAVVIFALLLAVIPPVFDGQWAEWIRRGCVTLVVSCPCALVISIPLTFFGGIGAASKKGVLVKGACWLETLEQVKTIVFDKTGTITEGVFDVVAVQPAEGVSAEELMTLTVQAEHYSDHPIAKSVRRGAGFTADEAKIDGYREIFGQGIRVLYDGAELLAGNERLMEQYGVKFVPSEETGTHVYIAYRGRFMGSVTAADRMKPDVRETIAELKRLGVERTVMLTGDGAEIAGKIAADAGIDEFHAGLLPDDKLNLLETLMADGKTTAFVGDGINDAPALARADVGVAMAGLDAAMEAGDMVLMNSDPAKLADAMKIARRTRQIVTQNIVFSLAVKGVFIVLGAVGISGMWEAVFGDVGVMVIAVLNAMRILREK